MNKNEWIKIQSTHLYFYLFKLSEKFAVKQKYSKDNISQSINIFNWYC